MPPSAVGAHAEDTPLLLRIPVGTAPLCWHLGVWPLGLLLVPCHGWLLMRCGGCVPANCSSEAQPGPRCDRVWSHWAGQRAARAGLFPVHCVREGGWPAGVGMGTRAPHGGYSRCGARAASSPHPPPPVLLSLDLPDAGRVAGHCTGGWEHLGSWGAESRTGLLTAWHSTAAVGALSARQGHPF